MAIAKCVGGTRDNQDRADFDTGTGPNGKPDKYHLTPDERFWNWEAKAASRADD